MAAQRSFRNLFVASVATLSIAMSSLVAVAVFGGETEDYVTNIENGDLDGNDKRNLTDVIRLINYLFHGGPPPVPARCEFLSDDTDTSDSADSETPSTMVENGDLNGDGSINITDVINYANWLFSAGEEPVELGCE